MVQRGAGTYNWPVSQAVFQQARAHFDAGRYEQALAVTQRALQRDPKNADFNYLHAGTLSQLGRFEQAIFFAQRAAAARPDRALYAGLLGEILFFAGKLDEATPWLERAASMDERQCSPRMHLGHIAQHRRDFTTAERWFREADSARPELPEGITNVALVLNETLRGAEACELLRERLGRFPEETGLLTCLAALLNYAPGVEPAEVSEVHRRLGRAMTPGGVAPAGPARRDRPLRVGYVSPDFREHSCSRFIEALLEHHDRARVTVHCYFNWSHADATTARLKGRLRPGDQWRDVAALGDGAFADLVRRDEIDVLIDLAGLTHGNRLTAMARRPAPMQATYLGYPNTTGSPAVDFRIVDEVTDSPGAEALATERLVRLPGCFLCYKPPPEAPPAEREGDGPPTFVSFNILGKVNEGVVRAWARVLRAVPGSRMMLKARSLSDARVRERLAAMFGAHGVGAERLEILSYAEKTADHLSLYRRADIGLDTFPYNGTTTTCEALFMGVPVVTMAGRSHAGRVGASLLRAAGLGEHCAADEDGFVEIAARLGAEVARVRADRAGLRSRLLSSSLCDGAGFARRFEEALRSLSP